MTLEGSLHPAAVVGMKGGLSSESLKGQYLCLVFDFRPENIYELKYSLLLLRLYYIKKMEPIDLKEVSVSFAYSWVKCHYAQQKLSLSKVLG